MRVALSSTHYSSLITHHSLLITHHFGSSVVPSEGLPTLFGVEALRRLVFFRRARLAHGYPADAQEHERRSRNGSQQPRADHPRHKKGRARDPQQTPSA